MRAPFRNGAAPFVPERHTTKGALDGRSSDPLDGDRHLVTVDRKYLTVGTVAQ